MHGAEYMKKNICNNIKNEKIWWILFGIIICCSIIRFFYAINGDYFTFLDEYTTFDTAVGFTHAGKFYHWDFQNQKLTDYEYTRAWPHTILLMLWFKIFGISVVAGKTLSAVFGVLFIASFFYITKKIYQNYYISVLSSLIVMTNSTVITVFRQIRMYSLWMLIMVWLMYFFYEALTSTPKRKMKSHFVQFVEEYFNFSLKYILLSIFILALGYSTHMNTLAVGIGIFLFFVYCLLTKREKRYYMAALLIIAILLIIRLAFAWLITISPAASNIYWWLVKSGHIGIREDWNVRYWNWTVDFVHSRRFFWGTLICMAIAFIKNIRKRNHAYDFSVYLFLTVSSSLVCFVYILTRYYQARYMLYVAPMIAILMAWGIVETFSICKIKAAVLLASVACFVLLGVNVGQTFTEVYKNPEICYHREVYEILRQDAEKELDGNIIPIAGYDFRDYYGVQVIDNYVKAPFDRENDMEILKDFAVEYPDGYVLVESAKINGFPEVIKNFIQRHSERIAGDGIDCYNIEAVRYHFQNPISEQLEMNSENMVQNGPITYSFNGDGTSTKINVELDTSLLEDNVDTTFLKFGIFTFDKETEEKCYQLRLPQQYSDGKYYYEIIMDKACQAILLKDECMLYYADGSCKEKMLYEK